MPALCGANCEECGWKMRDKCKGCAATDCKPFGKQCFIGECIKLGGKNAYDQFKQQIIDEFNALNLPEVPKITELYALNGTYVNLEYPLPNGIKTKFLDDSEIYLGTQVESIFNDRTSERCFGLLANSKFLLVSEYGKGGIDPEIVVYKRR